MRTARSLVTRGAALCGVAALAVAACSSSSSSQNRTATSTGAGSATTASGSATSAASGGYAPIPSGPITVGQIYPLSGPQAAFGQSANASTKLFVDQLNAAGGIDGHQVTLVTGDDKGDPAVGVQEAQRLINESHISVMLEPGFADALQIVPLLTKDKIADFASLPEHDLNNPATYPYYFNFYPLDTQIGTEMVKYAKTLGVTKLGIARDTTPYGDSYLPSIQAEAKNDGITIAGTVSFDQTAVDVSTQVRQLKSEGADGVAIVSIGPVVGHVYQAMQGIGWAPKIVGTGALNISGTTSLGSLASDAFYGCGIAATSTTQLASGIQQQLSILNQKFGQLPRQHADTLYGRDSLFALKAAIEKYHSTDAAAIAKAMESFSNVSYTDASVTYSFSPTNHSGFPSSEVKMCDLSSLGPEGSAVFAPNS